MTWAWCGPGRVSMQSTGQTDTQASQPVHRSSSSSANCLGSFLAMARL